MVIIDYANGCRASYTENFASRVTCRSGRQFVINGPLGQIWASLNDRQVTLYKTHRWPSTRGETVCIDVPDVDEGHGGADAHQMRHILACLAGREDNVLSGECGRAAVLVGVAAETAAQERRVVDISSGCVK